MDNLGCNRSTCSKRKPHTPDSSLASSLEELDNLGLGGKKTEISPSTPATKSSSEKAYMPDNSQFVDNQIEDPKLFKSYLKQLFSLTQNTYNYMEKEFPDISTEPNCNCQDTRMSTKSEDMKRLYLEIPLDIRLKTITKCSKSLPDVPCTSSLAQPQLNVENSVFSSGQMPSCLCTLYNISSSKFCLMCQCRSCSTQTTDALFFDSNHEGPVNKSTQTSPISFSDMSFHPDGCDDIALRELDTDRDKPQRSSSTSSQPSALKITNHENDICDCGRPKVTVEEYEALMLNPNAKLPILICEKEKKCFCDFKKTISTAQPVKKIYRLVYPQHKDLNVCVKCRFDPSPLIDEEGNVFCPGNCGCCLCPWKPRATNSLEDVLRHSKIKICKCRNRGTIFTGIGKYDSACSQVSYFDMCPCREKAEAKHLELFGYEMFDRNKKLKNKFRGKVVALEEVKEVYKKKHHSKKGGFSNFLFNDD